MSPARGLQWHGRQRRPEHGVAVAAEVRAELADDAAASLQLEQERVAAELRRALRRLVLPVEVFLDHLAGAERHAAGPTQNT